MSSLKRRQQALTDAEAKERAWWDMGAGAAAEHSGEMQKGDYTGPPMLDLLWTVLSPPDHNKLRTVSPNEDSPQDAANALASAPMYETLQLEAEAANFTVLDFGSCDGGFSLKVARKHPTSTVVSVALARNDEEHKLRINETKAQMWLGNELGTTNNLVCQPPIGTSPSMLLWWLHRQPVLFDYVFISGQASDMLIAELLPHELEAVISRAMQLAKVIVVQTPGTSAVTKYMKHWGDSQLEGLINAAAYVGKATDLSIHYVTPYGVNDPAVRTKSSFERTVCLGENNGLFLSEKVQQLGEDFQDEIDACLDPKGQTTALLSYDKIEGGMVASTDESMCVDDRCELHPSIYTVVQLGLGEGQRRALFASSIRIDISPETVLALAEQYQNPAAAVFIQGSTTFVNRWVEVDVPEPTVEPDVADPSGSGACNFDADNAVELNVDGSTGNDPKTTVEHAKEATLAARMVCAECTCDDDAHQCTHSSFPDTWELVANVIDETTTQFVVHRVDKDTEWGYSGIKIQYTVCHTDETTATDHTNGADGTAPSPPNYEVDGENAEGQWRRQTAEWGNGWAYNGGEEEDTKLPDEETQDESPLPLPLPEPEPLSEQTPLVGMRITGADKRPEDEFDLIWPKIRRITRFNIGHPSTLVHGNQKIAGLLAAKIARRAKTGTVVVIASIPALQYHHTLFSALGTQNALICSPESTLDGAPVAFVETLAHSPTRLSFQFIGAEIFSHALTKSADDFVQLIGQTVALATTSFIEIPDPRSLAIWLNMLSRNENAATFLSVHPYLGPPPDTADGFLSSDEAAEEAAVADWMRRLCVAFATAGGVEDIENKGTIEIVTGPWWGQKNRMVRIHHGSAVLKRSMSRADSADLVPFSLQNGLWVETTPSSFLHQLDRTPAQLSLQNDYMLSHLLDLGLLNTYKNDLFMEYLSIAGEGVTLSLSTLPTASQLSVRCAKLTSALTYMNDAQLLEFCSGKLDLGDLVTENNIQLATSAWKNAMALPLANFSLLTYANDDPGLGGEQARSIALDTAKNHPDSTVIAIMPHVDDFSQSMVKNGIKNVLPIRNHVDQDLIGRLYRSPEFFQFQVMQNILHFMHAMGRGSFSEFLEQILSICSTTFYSMPSGTLLSDATSMFYGIPADTFRGAEKKLLLETIDNSHHLRSVAMKVYEQVSGSSIVRVVTTNMSRTVHHHFDYEIDGHQRTYRMRSNGPKDVYLTREEDEGHIPYTINGQPIHFGLTLISILRLGVTTETRDQLYGSFLKMPLYEDMAPWNIFWEKDKLIYIDYDTRNLVFDDAVPMAYQVMEVLMNYKRTVEDFKRCDSHAHTGGWLPQDKTSHISECVYSSFDGPCKDPGKPVPCSDQQCHHTYVDCLRAIYELELAETNKISSLPKNYEAIKSKLIVDDYFSPVERQGFGI